MMSGRVKQMKAPQSLSRSSVMVNLRGSVVTYQTVSNQCKFIFSLSGCQRSGFEARSWKVCEQWLTVMTPSLGLPLVYLP